MSQERYNRRWVRTNLEAERVVAVQRIYHGLQSQDTCCKPLFLIRWGVGRISEKRTNRCRPDFKLGEFLLNGCFLLVFLYFTGYVCCQEFEAGRGDRACVEEDRIARVNLTHVFTFPKVVGTEETALFIVAMTDEVLCRTCPLSTYRTFVQISRSIPVIVVSATREHRV